MAIGNQAVLGSSMFKKLSRRDRIALGAGAGVAALFVLLNFVVLPLVEHVDTSADSIQQKEIQLRREKRMLAGTELDRSQLSAARERLKVLESGLLESSSPSLANAEWQRLVEQLAESKGVDLGSSEFLHVQELSAGYSLVVGRVQLRCRLDQLVNFMAALADFPKLLSVTGLTVYSSPGDPQGRLTVQLTIGAATRTPNRVKEQPSAR